MLITNKEKIHNDTKEHYQELRDNHEKRVDKIKLVSMPEARRNKYKINWEEFKPVEPTFLGAKEIKDVQMSTLVDYIDWSPFFSAWRLKGAYPKIFEDEKVGEEAKKLFADAQTYLQEIIDCPKVQNKAVLGFFEASSQDEMIDLNDCTLHMLRSQRQMKEADSRNRCLADYIAPKETGIKDYIGAFVVTTGLGLETLIEKYELENDDYAIIMVKSLADRLAEAFAEYLHLKVRTEYWGYASDENLSSAELIREKYKGIRPAPGYAACPDHSEKKKLFKLLNAQQIGVELTESCAMTPASSVSGWYFGNPEARYFNVGKITEEQVKIYSQEKGYDLEEAKKWLRYNMDL
jgi:5-methyltetrahydrofolate--homocysteine methyltransferase